MLHCATQRNACTRLLTVARKESGQIVMAKGYGYVFDALCEYGQRDPIQHTLQTQNQPSMHTHDVVLCWLAAQLFLLMMLSPRKTFRTSVKFLISNKEYKSSSMLFNSEMFMYV